MVADFHAMIYRWINYASKYEPKKSTTKKVEVPSQKETQPKTTQPAISQPNQP